MCAMVGAMVGMLGSVMQGMAGKQMADYEAKVAKINAEAAIREAFAQSGATRDQFSEARGEQTAALAKSGVDINTGTAATLGLETQRREEHAAAVDIWKGRTEQTKFKNIAEAKKAEGKAAMMGGIIGGISSLVGGLSGMGQGKALSAGQAAPAVTGMTASGPSAGLSSPPMRLGLAAPKIKKPLLTYGGPR